MTKVEEKIDAQLGLAFEKLSQAIDGMEKRETGTLHSGVSGLLVVANELYAEVFGTGYFAFEKAPA